MNEEEEDFPIDLLQLPRAAHVLKAVNHALRQRLLLLLHRKGKAAVTDIYQELHLDQTVASQHLAILRRTGFVTTQRKGRHIFYSVQYERLRQVQRFASNLLHGVPADQ